jgi:hypothetical protein
VTTGLGWHRIFIWQLLRGTVRKEFVTGYPLLAEKGSLRDLWEVSHMGSGRLQGKSFFWPVVDQVGYLHGGEGSKISYGVYITLGRDSSYRGV